MDQYKIGKFIAECRKEKKLTQIQLAEKLGITDRAVSKWENGKAMPDSAIMLELCDLLEITVNDLLNGEKVSSEDYNRTLEEKLLEIINEKERSDKLLTRLINIIGIIVIPLTFLAIILTWRTDSWWGVVILYFWEAIGLGLIILMSRIYLLTGYYQCEHCGQVYTPTLRAYLCGFGWSAKRMRLKCCHCGKRTVHTKVSRKE